MKQTRRTHLRSGLFSTVLAATLTLAATNVTFADSSEREGSDGKQGDKRSSTTSGGIAAPVQSSARPLGLNIVAPVMAVGSDTASANFQKKVLPSVTDLVNTRLSERKSINDSAMLLDPSKLQLQTKSDVRVYFIGEGAGYHNTLGFNAAGSGVSHGDPRLIFPDASSPVSTYDPEASGKRSAREPLLPGDFVNLGTFAGGTKLDFFLISDGANGGKNVFSTDKSQNTDHINHVVSFAYAVKESPYLIVSFEDMYGGGDRDFNDVVFAVDIGAANIAKLMGTPEPALWLTMASFVGFAVWLKRRQTLQLSPI